MSTSFAAALAVMALAGATNAQARCWGCGPYYYGYGGPWHYGWKPGYPHYKADDYYNQDRQLQGTR